MRNRKFNFMAMIFFISVVFLTILGKATSVEAAIEVIIPSTDEVYAVAPKGVKLNDYVTAPVYYKNTSTNNDEAFKSSNTIYRAGDTGNSYSNQSDIIQLLDKTTTRTTQLGSFWGNIKDSDGARTYNYFDLNKDQELSAWVYNGGSSATSLVNDGFAFVLQTDPNGTQAISRSHGAPVGGETLGVWGGGTVNNATSTSKMLTTDPINNGVAIEFDKILNVTPGTSSNKLNDYMDFNEYTISYPFVGRQVKDNHISWGYPGDQDMYLTGNYGTLNSYYYYYMKHRSAVKNGSYLSGYDEFTIPLGSKADPKLAWRHIQIKYKASTSTLTYIYNDKFTDGSPKIDAASNSDSFVIDKTKFTSNRAYWGFTAATGSPKSMGQDMAIVMEKMPAVADIKPNVILSDVTKDTTSTDGNTVAATDGDDLKLDYNLTYNGGLTSSGDIKATIALPENIDYDGDSSGNIGKVIYKATDGSTVEKEINKSEIKDITITIPGENLGDLPTYRQVPGIEVSVPALNNIGDVGTVEINGKAHGPTGTTIKTITVAAAHANFTSENYVDNAMSPIFTISNEKLQITNSNSLTQELTPDDTVHFKGSATYLMGTKFDGNSVRATVKVYDQDGKSINADLLGDISIASGATTGTFDIPYSLKDLTGGQTYTFKVTLTDYSKRVSNALVYTVKVDDNKKLVMTKNNYLNYTVVEKSNALALKAHLTYDNNSTVTPSNITTYMQVDDETPISGTLSATQAATSVLADFEIKSNSLSLGTHKIKIYATDGKKNSNVVEYDFKVIEHGIILTPDKETIDVKNNDPVNLGWNVQYSSDDDDSSDHTGKFYKTELKIKNEGDSDYRDFYFLANTDKTENVNGKIDVAANGDFDFDVNPIDYNKIVISNTKNYLDQLKEGRNEIKFQVSSDGMTSEEKTVIINVPKLTPALTSPRKIVYARGTGSSIAIPMQFEYKEDSAYTTKVGQIPIKATADNGKTAVFLAKQATINEGPPLTFDVNGTIMLLGLSTSGGPYTLHLSTADPYGRQGADYDLILEFVNKVLKLEVSNQYDFRDIDYHDRKNDYIARQGNWRIVVDSLGAKWNLQAQSDGLFNEKDSSYSEPLVFLNKDDQEEALTSNPVIAQRNTAVTVQDLVENISSAWDDDDGILLKNSMPNLSGDYKGKIQWTLTEAP